MDSLIAFGLTNAATAGVLAIAAAAIARFTRRPALWYALWLVVLLRLLAPPIFAVDLAIPDFGREAATGATELVEVAGGTVSLAGAGFSLDPIAVIAALWAAGAMAVVGFAVAQSFQLRQILTSSEPAPATLGRRVADLSRRLGLRRVPPTVVVEDRVPPMLWAFLGSVRLILPTELLARLDDRETDTLLAHELAHLSRRDHWVRHLELAALALFWWNPVAWWATRRVRRAQELCCDQRVAALLPANRRAYADTLVETARFLSGRSLPVGSPARAMADLTQMKGRIQMIMSTDRARDLGPAARLGAAAILLAVLAISPVLTADTDDPEALGRPISLELRDASVQDVLATFSKLAGKDILVEPGIDSKVTITIKEIPWDQALDIILEQEGLRWEKIGDRIIIRRGDGGPTAPIEPSAPQAMVTTETVHKFVEGGDITEPEIIEKTPPTYPEEMRKGGVSGLVIAELVIDTNGQVRHVDVKESPAPELAAAATAAIESWTFKPATKDGEPITVSYIVTIKFSLQ
ncbi:MAG: TonB family protein [Thermoanaerobaculales bacterium]|jgi:TonB family protein|nr:TonB family protein [Thermoanaerobaculales bacterium]